MAGIASIPSVVLTALSISLSIYLFVRLALVAYIALIEQAGPLTAVNRSWALVGGRWPRSFGLLLLVLLLSGLLQAAFEVSAAPFPEAGALIAAIAVAPITTIGNLSYIWTFAPAKKPIQRNSFDAS